MHTPHFSIGVALMLLMVADDASSEPLYVSDKLVLNVYAEANQGGGRVATIETGDAVEELERVDNFVRVRLSDGREGWVGANYLSTQPPAVVQLKQLQTMSSPAVPAKQSSEELARLQKQNAALSAEITEFKKKAMVPAVASAPAAEESASAKTQSAVEPETSADAAPPVVIERNVWWAWALAVIAAGAGGFVAGYQTLGRRVRERFGGVKVY